MGRETAEGDYEAANYHRLADDIVITVSRHHTKRGWAERTLQRLHEQLAPFGAKLNREKPGWCHAEGGSLWAPGIRLAVHASAAETAITS
jgi:hypothetical protein